MTKRLMPPRSRCIAVIGGLASQTEEVRDKAMGDAIKSLLLSNPKTSTRFGGRFWGLILGNGNKGVAIQDYHFPSVVSVMSLWDLRLVWTALVREAAIDKAIQWQKRKLRQKMSEPEVSALDDLDYVLLNVGKNLWVGEDGTFTDKAEDAKLFKRREALDGFIDECCTATGDYNVPIRLQDLVMSKMNLDVSGGGE